MANSTHFSGAADIAIVGAGIGGTAAALALQRAGFVVEVFEQAEELREVGGAIILRDPSIALLAKWNLLGELQPKMVAVREIEMRESDGSVKGSMPITFQDGEGEFAYSVHRADVHNALAAGIAPERLHLGHRLTEVVSSDDYAEARFDNGTSVRARLIVGADGLKSKVRGLLDQSPMHFNRLVTHRTISPASLLPADMPNDRVRMWAKDQLILVILPIRGGLEVAIDAVIPAHEPPDKLWSSTSPEQLLSVYADFDPLLTELIIHRNVDVTTHPVYDKNPIDTWTDGRVVLLGDAAHPMAPLQGQGANQAIQDAGALAEALTGPHRDDQSRALLEYQSTRAPVAGHFQMLSRKRPERPASAPAAG